ncbi:TetR/AcrR family transcriptional regulator [Clostridium sp. MB40-C1]|uniref:TetR/AcrR family transcriptional regulator n=1 Tax=Clostridium sp. MB40-C1 TaxID=3070996 RepID=UPI0027E1242E|nr:TetR/AcrR family transcriptional regulator [Clostridium sp. MB40-C1]WMJ80879.1 TetR/AcrR family transcriptional regulator [Clostridium sp. MB40-C1]
MPKQYDGLEKKILDCAEKKFIHSSYSEVSMRKIAKDLNISVGTIYNYYSNKDHLFISVLKYSWDKTFSILKEVTNSNYNVEKKLELFFKSIFNELNRRNGIGRQIFKIQEMALKDISTTNKIKNSSENEFTKFIQDSLMIHLKKLSKELEDKYKIKLEDDEREKLVLSIITTTFVLCNQYLNQITENTKFILELVNGFYITKSRNFHN